MAPTTKSTVSIARSTVSTRSKSNSNLAQLKDLGRGKRKADCSPSKEKERVKRSAFGDVTNAIFKGKQTLDDKSKPITKAVSKKVLVQSKVLPSVKTVVKPKQNENLAPPPAPVHKIVTRAAAVKQVVPNQTAQKPKEGQKDNGVAAANKKRLSNEFEKTEESLYSSALEEIAKKPVTRSSKLLTEAPLGGNDESKSPNMSLVAQQMETKLNLGNHDVPEGIDDFDKENWNDVFQVSHYAMDIFNYLKEREQEFKIPDYMERQICLTKWMRSLLVDWMVEIQESFELNHETLYLGVKLVDTYLSRMSVSKEMLQLVGAGAMFIASKYDERIPPSSDDFLYICDGAYSKRELIRMEINILKVCGFELGVPISYRFLRRYARCAKVSMPVLTLARYILELSLMDYATVTVRDSKLAAAALYLALRMKNISGWTNSLQFYTGYILDEIKETVYLLNDGLHKPVKSQLMTVRNKYSHKIFFEVAKTPLIENDEL